MTENHTPACRSAGRDRPRIIPRRHTHDCDSDTCAGCQPCEQRHCVDCHHRHVDPGEYACPDCVKTVRTNLDVITDKYSRLPDEAIRRGVNSDAADLLGPVTNIEAWAHRQTSALSGRVIPAGTDAKDIEDLHAWYDHADTDTHPLWSLPLHADLARDALDHAIPTAEVSVYSEAGYLADHLTELARCEHYDWRTMATHLARTRTRLDVVTHDENHGDRANVGCFDCGARLERKLTDGGFEDEWTCRGCRRRYSQTDYNLALHTAIKKRAAARLAEEQRSA